MQEFMQSLENIPPFKWAFTHPRIAAWVVLSAGMVILLVIEARDVGLEPLNWVSLVVMTVLVAGACIWIVSWEDEDESEPLNAKMGQSTTETAAVSADAGDSNSTDAPSSAKTTEEAPDK